MDTPEMTEISVKVEFLGYDRVTRSLLQVETGWGDEITGSKEVSHLGSDIPIRLCQDA